MALQIKTVSEEEYLQIVLKYGRPIHCDGVGQTTVGSVKRCFKYDNTPHVIHVHTNGKERFVKIKHRKKA